MAATKTHQTLEEKIQANKEIKELYLELQKKNPLKFDSTEFDLKKEEEKKLLFLRDTFDSACRFDTDTINKLYKYCNEHKTSLNREPYRITNLKYRYCNFLSYKDRIIDGFFDCGRSCESNDSQVHSSFNNYVKKMDGSIAHREIIYINSEEDGDLFNMQRDIIKIMKTYNEFIEPHKGTVKNWSDYFYHLIADFVETRYGRDASDTESNNDIKRIYTETGNNLVHIGKIQKGVCRQKGIMFKYLCDLIGLDCALIRGSITGGNHVWNLIEYDGSTHLVDVRSYQHEIIPLNDSRIDRSKYIREGYNRAGESHVGASVFTPLKK